ncbi:putative ribonuclease H-like domain-containing protein [Tanacetum coccineum]
MSFDDLYNNFKIVEQEVKRIESSNSSSSSQNMAFVSSLSSTNEVNTPYRISTANTQVSLVSTQVSTASTQVNTANLSDATVYAFLAKQPNGSQLVHEDLEQIHEDDLKEIDLKWQLALLSMRTRRNQDSFRRTINVEETSSKAMVAIDGSRFDWSYISDDEVPTNMALMAFSDSEVYNDKTCSNTCLKSFETLKTQLDDLRIELNKSEFNLATYKRGLTSVEEKLVFYKKNEVIFCEQLVVLKRDISYKDSEISILKSELEKLKQEKESNQLKIEKLDNDSKSLNKLIGSHITDKSKKGVGFVSYNAVPPPPTGLFSPPNLDLSNSGLEEFQQPEFKAYGPKTSKSVSEDISNEVRESLDAPLVEELVSNDKLKNKTVFPTIAKIEFVRPKQHEKPVMKPVKYAEMYRSFDHVQADCNYHQKERVVFGNNYTRVNYNYTAKNAHPSAHRNMIPRAVLIKTGLRSLNTARPVNTAHPKTTVYSARPMPKAVNTTRPNSAVVMLLGQIRLMLLRPQHVGFGDLPNLITLRNLMEDILPLGEELKEGKLLMCEKNNSVLLTNTGCFILSPDFKFADESQVLLKVPRKNNMYSVDIKNIVPKESLTFLVAKATLNESILWHRRLGHVNFKTINKLVKENLVRGLPTKRFENDQTCIACLKGKQHKASYLLRCNNGTEFKNRVMSEFCEKEDIKKEFSVARTPQQNGVAERRNRTLIEAAKTMLADSKLPTTFWAEAVNIACYVQNRVLVVKPHNKTPYELFRGRTPALSFMRPFGCHVTILNTLDYLGKFDGKSDEGFFIGYSMNSKAFRVYNIRTRKVEENLHIRFLEDKLIIAGDGPKWMFDIDVLTKSMNYVPVVAGTNSNDSVGIKESISNASNDEPQPSSDARKKDDEGVSKGNGIDDQERPENSTQGVNTVRQSINTASINGNTENAILEATHVDFFGDEAEVDMSNITTTYPVPSTPNTKIHKDHSLDHVIGDVQSGVQTRRMTKTTNKQGFISAVYEGKTHEDLHTCLFACFLSQEEPKKVIQALKDPRWIEAMQEELLQFKLQQVWTLVDLPHGKRAVGTKWVYRNKKDERVTRIEKIRLFLAYASFKDFVVEHMDVKRAFLHGKIKEEVYVCQPPGFDDPEFPDRVYKTMDFKEVWTISDTKDDGIFISQDKYVDEILKMFGFLTVKTASTPMETSKPLMKDENAEDIDVHLYRSMIGSLMYLTFSRPVIMFVVCACARFQVTPKVSHLHVVKRIFRYLKG